MSHPILSTIFLAGAVLAVGAGCAGLVRMRGAAARLHYVNLATLAAPPLILAAVLSAEGCSKAGIKGILIVVLLLLQGPVVTHVLGRAIYMHEHVQERASL